MKNNNLIAINGKSGSGKDLIASIIQYLTSGFADRKTYTQWVNWKHRKEYSEMYTIKKFAEPLKQIVCILTGCSMLDLENQEFKTTLSPLKCYHASWFNTDSSKREIALFLTQEEAILCVSKLPYEYLYSEIVNKFYTYRELLRVIGTDLFRNQLHPTIWSTALFAKFNEDENWIISDLRFKDELLAIQERKGITIKVTRPCSECGFSGVHANTCSKKDEVLHQSEHDLDEATFDYCIINNSTIDSLIEKVKHILTTEKII
jgi:hypothetical protein